MAATWVVLGAQGIKHFEEIRRCAITDVITTSSRKPPSVASTSVPSPNLLPGDYFHDGRNVLEVVKNWHALLRTSLRNTDTITSRVLDLVDSAMLIPDNSQNGNARATAGSVYSKLQNILSTTSPVPMPNVTIGILKQLVAIDSAAKVQDLPVDKDEKKNILLRSPPFAVKTSHRSERTDFPQTGPSTPPPAQYPRPFSPPDDPNINHNTPPKTPSDTGKKLSYLTLSPTKAPSTLPVVPQGRLNPQNVLEAYMSIKRQKRTKKGIVKDPVLSDHFSSDDRDIVSSGISCL